MDHQIEIKKYRVNTPIISSANRAKRLPVEFQIAEKNVNFSMEFKHWSEKRVYNWMKLEATAQYFPYFRGLIPYD